MTTQKGAALAPSTEAGRLLGRDFAAVRFNDDGFDRLMEGIFAIEAEAREPLRSALVSEHRKAVSEFSGNFGGHVGIREGWVEYDAETPIEDCETCELIRGAEAQRTPLVPVEFGTIEDHDGILAETEQALHDAECGRLLWAWAGRVRHWKGKHR